MLILAWSEEDWRAMNHGLLVLGADRKKSGLSSWDKFGPSAPRGLVGFVPNPQLTSKRPFFMQ